jgi:hypothetical protein
MTTKRLTAEDLATIEARANAATGGEWVAYEPTELHGDIRIARSRDEYPDGRSKNTYVGRLVESHVGHEKPRREDGAFIAAARSDVPRLVAEVRALTDERDYSRIVAEEVVARGESQTAELNALRADNETLRRERNEALNERDAAREEHRRAEERASLHAAEGVRLGERYAVANGRAVRVAMERDDARAEVARYRQREEHFANALRVADGGQYHNDWDGAIRRVLAEHDAARAEVERLMRLATGPHINEEDDSVVCRQCGGTGRDSDYASCNCGDAHTCRWCGGTGERS